MSSRVSLLSLCAGAAVGVTLSMLVGLLLPRSGLIAWRHDKRTACSLECLTGGYSEFTGIDLRLTSAAAAGTPSSQLDASRGVLEPAHTLPPAEWVWPHAAAYQRLAATLSGAGDAKQSVRTFHDYAQVCVGCLRGSGGGRLLCTFPVSSPTGGRNGALDPPSPCPHRHYRPVMDTVSAATLIGCRRRQCRQHRPHG